MGSGILDYIDSNWASILGLNSDPSSGVNAPVGPPPGQGYGGGTPPAPPPGAPNGAGYGGGAVAPPPSSYMASGNGSFSPSGAADGNALSPDAQAAALGIPPSAVTMPGTYGAQGGGPMAGTANANPPPSGGAVAATNPPAPPEFQPPNFSGVPNGSPMGGQPPSQGGGPMAGTGAIPTSTGPVTADPTNILPNMGGNPATPPPASAMNAPPPVSTAGGLAGAFGLNGAPSWGNTLETGLAGLGKGLTAAGNLRPGASGAQAFAAGAGGALTGGINNTEQQKKMLFDQSSTAFRDMLAAKNSDNASDLTKARSNYFTARAQEMMTGAGGKGTSAWQNTPYGKTIQVENEAQKYEKGQQIILQTRWQLNRSTPDEQQKDLDNLNKNVEAYRNRLYKQAGIDPNQAEKLKNMGTSPDQPFETNGMTLDQFNAQVPMGGWFKDQNGVVRQRTVPPPDQQQAPDNRTQRSSDDQLALEEPTGALQ